MPIPIEHRLMVIQSLLRETERDAAIVATEFIIQLARTPEAQKSLADEACRRAAMSSGPRATILRLIANRITKIAEEKSSSNTARSELKKLN